VKWLIGTAILASCVPILACGGSDSNASSWSAPATSETQASRPGPWEVYSSGPASDISSGWTAAEMMITTENLSGTLKRLAGGNTVETTGTASVHFFFASFYCSQLQKLPRGTDAFNTLDDRCGDGDELRPEDMPEWAAKTEVAAEDYFWQACPVDREKRGGEVFATANLAVQSQNLMLALAATHSDGALLFTDSDVALQAAFVELSCYSARLSPDGEVIYPDLSEKVDAPCSIAESANMQSLIVTGQRERASSLAADLYKAAAGHLVTLCSSALEQAGSS